MALILIALGKAAEEQPLDGTKQPKGVFLRIQSGWLPSVHVGR